jgi:predicted transcriptional regulator of viral defense system
MPRPSRLTIAKNDILRHFDELGKRVFTPTEIARILSEQRAFWRLATNTSSSQFIGYLTAQNRLRTVEFKSETYQKTMTRYAWGDASIYELALSLKKGAYLCHGTAVFLHGLTDIIAKQIYVNAEQSPKPAPSGRLTQQALDRAFANNQRQSNLTYEYDGYGITMISGKNTSRLGVETLSGPAQESLDVTHIERTLIDITVRPSYAGGVFKVLEAYRAAKPHVSINRLLATLTKLNYVYPYQQAIGFFMDRAGYDPLRLKLVQERNTEFDFYITYGLETPDYDSKWKLFHPQGL